MLDVLCHLFTWTTASFPDAAPVKTLFTFSEKAVESWL
jgi:hypothetical protein